MVRIQFRVESSVLKIRSDSAKYIIGHRLKEELSGAYDSPESITVPVAYNDDSPGHNVYNLYVYIPESGEEVESEGELLSNNIVKLDYEDYVDSGYENIKLTRSSPYTQKITNGDLFYRRIIKTKGKKTRIKTKKRTVNKKI